MQCLLTILKSRAFLVGLSVVRASLSDIQNMHSLEKLPLSTPAACCLLLLLLLLAAAVAACCCCYCLLLLLLLAAVLAAVLAACCCCCCLLLFAVAACCFLLLLLLAVAASCCCVLHFLFKVMHPGGLSGIPSTGEAYFTAHLWLLHYEHCCMCQTAASNCPSSSLGDAMSFLCHCYVIPVSFADNAL